MTPREVTLHPGVEDDLDDILDYYGQIGPWLPKIFRVQLRDQLALISLFPESGARLFDEFRRVVLPRFPYMVVYVVGAHGVVVLTVIHVVRDPGAVIAVARDRRDS